jgi:hypothetical protein
MPMQRHEQEAFESLEEWLNLEDPSLAGFLSRRQRFRHSRLVIALLFAVGPILFLAGLITHLLVVLIVGVALLPITPALSTFIVSIPRRREIERNTPQRKDDHDDAGS